MLTIFIPLLVDESSFFAHFMCFEVPALAPPGGLGNGNKGGLIDDEDGNDDDLGIMDIDDNDNKAGKNTAELEALNESLRDLLVEYRYFIYPMAELSLDCQAERLKLVMNPEILILRLL